MDCSDLVWSDLSDSSLKMRIICCCFTKVKPKPNNPEQYKTEQLWGLGSRGACSHLKLETAQSGITKQTLIANVSTRLLKVSENKQSFNI